MKKKFDSLDEVFNVTTEIVSDNLENEIIANKDTSNEIVIVNDIKKDYEYARVNMYSIIEKGQEALNGILELAQETESPRAYEVVGQLIKNVTDSTDKLIELQKKMKELDQKDISRGPTNVTNALFVGSTAELSKMLKNQLKAEDNK